MASAKETRRLTAHGRVQGVGYRAACAEEAIALGLTGWVRNRVDGTVEVVACGSADRLEALCAWMRIGPPAAQVSMVEVEALGEAEGGFDSFDFRPTV